MSKKLVPSPALWLSILAIAITSSADAGRVVATSTTSLTVLEGSSNQTYSVARETRITINGKEGKLEEIVTGMDAEITAAPDSNTATAIAAKGKKRAIYDGEVGYKAPERKKKKSDGKSAKPKTLFSGVSGGSGDTLIAKGVSSITVSTSSEGSKTYRITPETKFTIKGKPSRLENFRVGMTVHVDLAPDSDIAETVSASSK